MFDIGRMYDRRKDIHGPLGGQQQGGICSPAKHPYVILFTGDSGSPYGYRDGWDDNGVFLYTGEGQIGDMSVVRGNRAIRDHAEDGKDLLLFESLGKGRGVRYLGSFACAGYDDQRRGPDREGNDPRLIVFQLVKVGEGNTLALPEPSPPPVLSLKQLRDRAYLAAKPSAANSTKETRRTFYERDRDVRRYVLARADGVCESCGKPAPFARANGEPYLEPHHIRRVSDGGPDDPRWVVAVCPNCHREAHFGINLGAMCKFLAGRVGALEDHMPTGGDS